MLVHISKFVLTSNTVTYALLGRVALNTWENFPFDDDEFASTPAWAQSGHCGQISLRGKQLGSKPLGSPRWLLWLLCPAGRASHSIDQTYHCMGSPPS